MGGGGGGGGGLGGEGGGGFGAGGGDGTITSRPWWKASSRAVRKTDASAFWPMHVRAPAHLLRVSKFHLQGTLAWSPGMLTLT